MVISVVAVVVVGVVAVVGVFVVVGVVVDVVVDVCISFPQPNEMFKLRNELIPLHVAQYLFLKIR